MKLLTTTTESVVTSVEVDMTPEEMLKEAVQAMVSDALDEGTVDPMHEAGYDIASKVDEALWDYTPQERLNLVRGVMGRMNDLARELRSET